MEEGPKRKKLKHEGIYLENLPNYERYTKSYPNRGEVSVLAVQPGSGAEFVVTGTVEGYVKIWRKAKGHGELDFVKQYLAHSDGEAVVDCRFSDDGRTFVTISSDCTAKVFDADGLDMMSIIDLGFKPRAVYWVRNQEVDRIIVSEEASGKVHVYDPTEGQLVKVLEGLHKTSVGNLEYNMLHNCMVSADDTGMIEYWQPVEPFQKPSEGVFGLKSETDLYMFRKKKQSLDQLTISPDGKRFAVAIDEKAYLFSFAKGKLIREYEDTEQEEENIVRASQVKGSVVFDSTGQFLFHTTRSYIRQITIATSEVSRRFGGSDSVAFRALGLYQGNPNRKKVLTVEMATSENAMIAESQTHDPLLLTVSANRLYVFSRFDGTFESIQSHRDIPDTQTKTRQSTNSKSNNNSEDKWKSTTSITIHTTLGDIKVSLFPTSAPLAVQNFVTLCQKSYYDNTPFHRVIKRFMIQGGDPEGNGTGGESIWGKPFKDEFDPQLRHDKPYRLSMANAGKNTNGSQFFITTEKTPWLDDKHTIFGSVTSGFDVVQLIENLPTTKNDRPIDPPTIISTTLH